MHPMPLAAAGHGLEAHRLVEVTPTFSCIEHPLLARLPLPPAACQASAVALPLREMCCRTCSQALKHAFALRMRLGDPAYTPHVEEVVADMLKF